MKDLMMKVDDPGDLDSFCQGFTLFFSANPEEALQASETVVKKSIIVVLLSLSLSLSHTHTHTHAHTHTRTHTHAFFSSHFAASAINLFHTVHAYIECSSTVVDLLPVLGFPLPSHQGGRGAFISCGMKRKCRSQWGEGAYCVDKMGKRFKGAVRVVKSSPPLPHQCSPPPFSLPPFSH